MKRKRPARQDRKHAAPAAPAAPRSRTLLLLACLLAAGLLTWGRVVHNEFVLDDLANVVNNGHIRALTPVSRFFLTSINDNDVIANRDTWRPLPALANALIYRLKGLDPRPYHAVNVALHLGNALLVFALIQLLGAGSAASFGAALVFLLHPIQTETVSWVMQKNGLLSLFFTLVSLILYVRFRRDGVRLLYPLSLAAYALALCGKEMAVSLPLIVLLYEWLLRPEGRGGNRRFFAAVPFILVTLLYLGARGAVVQTSTQVDYYGGSTLSTALTTLTAFARYLKLLIVPHPLTVEYRGIVAIRTSLFDPAVLASAALLAALLAAAWRLRRARPLVSFGIFFFFLTLAPVANIRPTRAIMAERFLYPGMIGFGLCAGYLLSRIRNRALLGALLVASGGAYGWMSVRRNETAWRTSIGACREALRFNPRSADTYLFLGFEYLRRNDVENGLKALETGFPLSPHYRDVTERPDTAERVAAMYLETRHARFELISKLGTWHYYRGEYDKAREYYERGLLYGMRDDEMKTNLAAAFFALNRYADAARILEELVRDGTGYTETRVNLALAYYRMGETLKALQYCLQALKQEPGHAKAMELLKTLGGDESWLQHLE